MKSACYGVVYVVTNTLRGRKRPDVSLKLKTSWQSRSRDVSAEVRKKQSDAHLGQRLSEERREKMSRSQRERREREKLLHTGPKFSDEAREAMRKAKLGKPQSEEHKAKVQEARQAYFAKKREGR